MGSSRADGINPGGREDRPGDGPVDGPGLLAAMSAAADYLAESAEAIDRINIYPVPDNDTGTNMAATLQQACAQALAPPLPAGANQALAVLAQGAIAAGRGNSGVILAQALSSLADSAAPADRLDGPVLAAGLRAASQGARAAVVNPVEGTMLTVLQAAANGAGEQASRGPLAVLESALAAAEIATAKTIDQLPLLAQAGVTDAGGEGICAILRGLAANLAGRTPDPVITADPKPPGRAAIRRGYCLVALLEPEQPDDDFGSLRRWLSQGEFDSVVIAGGRQQLRIHLHTDQPESSLKQIGGFGRISQSSLSRLDPAGGRSGPDPEPAN